MVYYEIVYQFTTPIGGVSKQLAFTGNVYQ
jgi:hypothetical protein